MRSKKRALVTPPEQSQMMTALCSARLLLVIGLLLAVVSGGVLARAFRPLWRGTRHAPVDGEDQSTPKAVKR
jgi:hypothetical protein